MAAYKELCDKVRRSATGGLIFGALMLLIWYLMPDGQKYKTFGLIYLGLAALEFTAALWNKFTPSAEGILFDGIVLIVFGGSNLVRQYLIWSGQLPGPRGGSHMIWVLFGLWMLFQGWGHIRSYFQVRRAFGALRPTREHLRWYNDLIREVRQADPSADPTALDLPTKPPLRGKLLGDTAVFLQPNGEVLIASRRRVEIEPVAGKGDQPVAELTIEGDDFGRFPLDPDNWRNYAAWKGAGGQAPAPPEVRPARRIADDE